MKEEFDFESIKNKATIADFVEFDYLQRFVIQKIILPLHLGKAFF